MICSRTRTTSSTCGLKAKPVQVQAHPSPPGSNPGTDCTDLHRLSGGSVSCSCRTNARCSAPLPLGCDGSPGSAPYLCRSGAGVCRAPEPPRRTWTCSGSRLRPYSWCPTPDFAVSRFLLFWQVLGNERTADRWQPAARTRRSASREPASLRAGPRRRGCSAKKCGDVASECCAKSLRRA